MLVFIDENILKGISCANPCVVIAANYVCGLDAHCSVKYHLVARRMQKGKQSNSVSSWNDSDQKRFLALHTIHSLLDCHCAG